MSKAPIIIGVLALMICSSSSAGVLMMGGEETPNTTGPGGSGSFAPGPAPAGPAPAGPAPAGPTGSSGGSNSPAVINIPEGKAVKCTSNLPAGTTTDYVYRYTNGQLRHYPDPAIAGSWDSNWASTTSLDCAGLTKGDPMPANISEGRAVKCTSNLPAGTTTDYIYRYTNGQLRHYPNPTIASSWDSNWTSFLETNCVGLTKGDQMSTNIPEGKAVRCTSNLPAGTTTDYIYRYTNGQLRHYPNPEIAGKWDSNWASPMSTDCLGIPVGEAMS